MAKGFTDSSGKFRPTGNNGKSSRKKSIETIEGMTLEEQRKAEVEMSIELKNAILNLKPKFIIDVGYKPTTSELEKIIDKKTFEDSAEEDAYRTGFDRGLFFAGGVLTELNGVGANEKLDEQFENDQGIERLESVRDVREVALDVALENEENDRQFSPFEIIAKEINDSMFNDKDEQINEAWDQFDEGIADGMSNALDGVTIELGYA